LTVGEDRGGTTLEFGWELVILDVEVQADSYYCPAVLGAGLDQDSGELAAFDVDVVWPLDLALEIGLQHLGCFADGEGDGEGKHRVVLLQGADDC